MKGDRTNYGQGAEMTRVTVRLTKAQREALIALGDRAGLPRERSWADLIKLAIEAAS